MSLVWFFLILIGSMALFVTQRIPMVATSLLIIVSLPVAGLLTPAEAMMGFSSTATITVGAMFVLSGGLMQTGALVPIAEKLAQWSQGKSLRLVLAMALLVPFASAFINNTPVVVMMVPILLTICRKYKINPSKILMPLSYFAIIGGTCTLIGTSTNLLIHDLYKSHGGTGFSLFDFLPLGIIFLSVGSVYILLFGRYLLPERESLSALIDVEQTTHHAIEVLINQKSPLVGKKVTDVFQPNNKLRFLELVRDEVLYPIGRVQNIRFQAGDFLILEGQPKELNDFLDSQYAELPSVIEDDERVPMRTIETALVELVVVPESSFIGRRVRELGLFRKYGIKVMAVQREGRRHRFELRGMRIRAGDVLLAQASRQGIEELEELHELFAVAGGRKQDSNKLAYWALGIMGAVVLGALFAPFPLVIFALAGATAMLVTRCLSVKDAISSLDVNVLFLIIGTIPLGLALEKTGVLTTSVEYVLTAFGTQSPLIVLSALYLLTNVASALLSNSAVAVLMTPLAFVMSEQMGVDVKPLLVAIAFGASTSFVTPIGYQTNTIVMGPGGYSFGDFFKFGFPLAVVFWLLATWLIPVFWSF